MDMAWNLDSDRPIYAQILERIQRQIVSGEYAPGTKIPSVREMIKQIRKQLAAEQAAEFVKQMKELGFQKADILALIEQETGGEEA